MERNLKGSGIHPGIYSFCQGNEPSERIGLKPFTLDWTHQILIQTGQETDIKYPPPAGSQAIEEG